MPAMILLIQGLRISGVRQQFVNAYAHFGILVGLKIRQHHRH